MAGNRHRHGKGWPNYGSNHTKGPAANYTPRKRGPAQTPPRQQAEPQVEAAAS